jgi:hypothetical protein
MHKRLLIIINGSILPVALVLAFLTLTAFATFQDQRRGTTQDKFDESQFPIVEEYAFKAKAKEEQAKREVKAKRFRMVMPAVSWGVLAGIHHWPADFSALPVAESTTILIGEVTDATANLSDDRMAVYSDFIINPVSFFKDSCNAAKDSSVLVATRVGGRVKFQNGHTLLVFNSGLGMPRIGRRYLFFLKQTDADSELLTAYEIRDGKVIPLDSGTSIFKAYENVNEAVLIKDTPTKKSRAFPKRPLTKKEGK